MKQNYQMELKKITNTFPYLIIFPTTLYNFILVLGWTQQCNDVVLILYVIIIFRANEISYS